MLLNRRGFLAASAGAGALALAGCASGGSRTRVEDWPTDPPTENVTLAWWCANIASDDGGDLRPRLIEAFRERYPNIRIRVIAAPQDTDTNRTSLVTQIAAGAETPDIFMGDIAWPGQFARNNLAVPLSTLVEADFWDQYSEGLRTAASVDGEYYHFPVYIDEAFLVYRADLLDKHGLQVPNSWEELSEASRTLIDAGDVEYGFVWQGNVYEGLTCNAVEFTADAGGLLTNEDITASTANSSEARRAFEFMRQLLDDGVTPRANMTYIEQASLDAFTSGRAAFLRNWAYAFDTANSENSSTVAGKVGLRSRPGFDGGPSGNSTVGGWGNYINPHTLHPAAALTFAKWMASEEAQQIIVREGAVIPAREASLSSPDAEEAGRPQYRIAQDITLVPRPTASQFYPKVSQAVYVNTHAIALGQSPLEAGTDRMTAQMDRALAGEAL